MKTIKQVEELNDKIAQIECYYNNLINYFSACLTKSDLLDKIGETLDKAKAWDIFRAKCAKGGKVAGVTLTKKQRIDRARKASTASLKSKAKDKERRRQAQLSKGRKPNKTEAAKPNTCL